MKIAYNGGLFGNEALCYQGRGIVKELGKNHKVNVQGPKPQGFWSKYYNNFKGKEDYYVMNGHIHYLRNLVKEGHKRLIPVAVLECNFPKDWVDNLNLPEVKQIWTVSQFCKDLMIKNGVKNPIKVIYLGLSDKFIKNGSNLFPKDKSFKFFNVSAPHCIGERDRKGLDILIKSFKEEFGNDPKVKLILKLNTIYADNIYKKFGKQFDLNKYLGMLLPEGYDTSNISIITNYLKTEDLNNLYNTIDCGVFPSRGEGFGLGQAELIKIGKPVITTNYSSTNEFSDPKLRVKVKGMWPLDYQNQPPYYRSKFAEPDVEHLRKLMREVYQNKVQYSNKQLHSIFEELKWEKVGEKINNSLKSI